MGKEAKLMPNYCYKCPECGEEIEEFHHVEDRHNQSCPQCKKKMKIIIQPTTFHIFEPFWHPNLDKKPVYIKNKKHLKEESDKRNMTSYY